MTYSVICGEQSIDTDAWTIDDGQTMEVVEGRVIYSIPKAPMLSEDCSGQETYHLYGTGSTVDHEDMQIIENT